MSDPASIFGSSTPPATPDPNAGNGNPAPSQNDITALATLLAEIKNERGEQKYKTLNDALIGLKHAQEHIPQLNQKLSQMTEENETLKAATAKVSEIEKTVQALTQKIGEAPTNAPTVSEELIAELVSKTLTKSQLEALAVSNTQAVVEAMRAKFGDTAEKVYQDKAKELGISVQEFNALAAKTPKAVLKLVGVGEGNSGFPSPSSSSVNTVGFTPRPDSKVGQNAKTVMIGATSIELKQETENAKALVEELHAVGKTVHDLTDPKVYFATFGKRG